MLTAAGLGVVKSTTAAVVQRAHVYGISLSGMIAQEITLRHPDRVARLVLGATTPRGPAAVTG